MSEQELTISPPQIADTPENWDSASQGYTEKVAPFLIEKRYGNGLISISNTATIGSGYAA